MEVLYVAEEIDILVQMNRQINNYYPIIRIRALAREPWQSQTTPAAARLLQLPTINGVASNDIVRLCSYLRSDFVAT